MTMMQEAVETPMAAASAAEFIRTRFPGCVAAFLAGSKIVVITPALSVGKSEAGQRHHVELLVYTPASYRQRFISDAQRREPALPLLCAEGLALVNDDGLADRIRHEARVLLARGPEPLGETELTAQRHQVTGLLDDFTGSQNFEEDLFIAAELTAATIELILSHNHQWSGRGKWAWRWLQRYNATLAETLLLALKTFYRTGGKSGLVTFVAASLEDAGGRSFAESAAGK